MGRKYGRTNARRIGRVKTCSLCDQPTVGRGWCKSHYYRWRRNGDPLGGRPTYGDDDARFRAAYRMADNGCHIWTKGADRKGYGKFYAQARAWRAHVWAWTQVNGPVPDGLQLDHFVCDTPACCNAQHVRPVTHRENVLRGTGPTAVNAAKTECIRGHPFTPENTYIQRDMGRVCRTCRREYLREWKRARQVSRRPEKTAVPTL